MLITKTLQKLINKEHNEPTEMIAIIIGELYKMLKKRSKREKINELTAQKFIFQSVLAIFAENRGLLPRNCFVFALKKGLPKPLFNDIIDKLFQKINQNSNYFYQGFLAKSDPIPLNQTELELLTLAAHQNWHQIKPTIFGNIFETIVNSKKRHNYGIHYTLEADIMKIVKPTISRYWEEKIETANTIEEFNKLQLELQNYRVLDPACGSGNFLYVAYQELKRIEQLLINKSLACKGSLGEQLKSGFVTPKQFYGIDINPFAVELAKVTLMIARKVAIDNLNLTKSTLSLDSLDHNIICADALFNEWPKADAIIGNPPFLGGKYLRLNLGDEYVDQIFQKYPKDVDFCSYWFRLAHDNIDQNGRVGLVGTNSISQGKSRKVSLDYITNNGGYIHEAISSQQWSGDAAVHVSIVNWIKTKPDSYYLDNQLVNQINSSLTTEIDVSQASKLKANQNICFQGVIPLGKGFYLDANLADQWLKIDSKNQEVIKLSCSARDLTDRVKGKPSRYIIDFNIHSLEEASSYLLPFEHLKTTVKSERDHHRDPKAKTYWWQLFSPRLKMRKAIKNLSFYFAIPRHSKWFIFIPINQDYLPADSTVIVASEDYYILGILTSNIHRIWINSQSSTIENTIRYTNTTCFETFPFPQNPTKEIVKNIRKITLELHQYRTKIMEQNQWGITKLYNHFFDNFASKLSKLHQELDQLVREAYHFNPDDDILEKLLQLNLELAEKEQQGEAIIGCWSPH